MRFFFKDVEPKILLLEKTKSFWQQIIQLIKN